MEIVAIRIGGVDIPDIPMPQVVGQTAFVFQATFLYNETVSANLRMAKPDATDAEVIAATKAARAHEFISAIPRATTRWWAKRGCGFPAGRASA